MLQMRNPRTMRIVPVVIAVCLIGLPAQAKYSGGRGEPNDPYQIATAADLILLGESPADYDRHFVLTADIDLEPNLPGRKVFDKAVISPDTDPGTLGFDGASFRGVLDGDGYAISHLRIKGGEYLGLFGQLASGAEVRDLGLVDVNIASSGCYVSGLVGCNWCGVLTQCYSTGVVSGTYYVGGLVGRNTGTVNQCRSAIRVSSDNDAGGLVGSNLGYVVRCSSTGRVSGGWFSGGLVGSNTGAVANCYSTGAVSGHHDVGGVVGNNGGALTQCYSTGTVGGTYDAGGLVGWNSGCVAQCYSSGPVNGSGEYYGSLGGGLVGGTHSVECGQGGSCGAIVTNSFWDTHTSGQAMSAGGTGKTTAEMKDIKIYLDAGWDFDGETANGTSQVWWMSETGGYPMLALLSGRVPPQLQGSGTANDPYLISNALELGAIVHYSPSAYYRLVASIDLSGVCWGVAVIPGFAGTFDGNELCIRNLRVKGTGYLGLFGQLVSGAEVRDLGMVDVNIAGGGSHVGGVVGSNGEPWSAWSGIQGGILTHCHSTGMISGTSSVGGLVGGNYGTVTCCYSTAMISGTGSDVGGLAGDSGCGAVVAQCYSTGEVKGCEWNVGGLMGLNYSDRVTCCYSTGAVSGTSYVGGLVGFNQNSSVACCYSTGAVSGVSCIGGLVGGNSQGPVTYQCFRCFWDTQISGQTRSEGGTGKTTAEMQSASTFLDAGWDFVGETANGANDIWWIDEGKDYPRLWWELNESKSAVTADN